MDSKLNENVISHLNNYRYKSLITKDENEPDDISIIKNVKLVGLYFGNTMSAQSRAFTKALKDLYNSVNSDNKVFEIIFITNEDEDNIRESLNRMPWYYREHDESDTKELREIFNAYEIPKLGIISNDGRILFKNISIDKLLVDYFKRWLEKKEIITDISYLRSMDQIKHK